MKYAAIVDPQESSNKDRPPAIIQEDIVIPAPLYPTGDQVCYIDTLADLYAI